MKDLVLAIDVGTQSIRALIFDDKGETVASEKTDYSGNYSSGEFFYNTILNTLKKLNLSVLDRVGCVTLATVRDSVILLDSQMNPLTDVILWTDQRQVRGEIKLPLWKRTMLTLVGMGEAVRMNFKTTRYNWFKENEPEILARTDKYVLLSTYLNYKLTGVLKDSVASQVGHVPFDSKRRRWAKRSISRCVFDIPMKMLCPLCEVGEEIGKVNIKGILENVPLIATGTDKGCESVGLSVIDEGKAAVSLGTATTIEFCSPRYFTPKPFVPSYPAVVKGYYNAETQIYRGFWTVKWFKENFCNTVDEKNLDEYLDQTPSGNDGLFMTPFMAPGIWNPYAKGMFTGLTDKHSIKHMYRAIIEGLAFELYHNMKSMEKRAGYRISEIYAGGGGSLSDKVLQILCNITGLPVKRIQTHEATSLGCAVVGFMYLGVFKTIEQASKAMSHDKEVFRPVDKIHCLYEKMYKKIYRHLEKKNTCIFKKMNDIQLQ